MKILLINQGKSNENLGDKEISNSFIDVLEKKGHTVKQAGFTQMNSTNMPKYSSAISKRDNLTKFFLD